MRLLIIVCLPAAVTMLNNNIGLTTVSLPLTVDGGVVRKCTPGYGTYGGLQESLLLHANLGIDSLDDTSDASDGWCAYHSNEDKGDVGPYSVSVDMYPVQDTNTVTGSGIAFNVLDKCTFDFAHLRPHTADRCFQLGSMRGCKWTTFIPKGPCPDGVPLWNEWGSLKVDVTATTVVFSKKKLGAAWSQLISVETSNIFGNHPVGRAGLIVAHGYESKVYFNKFELTYTATVERDDFELRLTGTAAIDALDRAKRDAVALFKGVSPDLSTHFVAEPSESTTTSGGFKTVLLPLTSESGYVRKCTANFGTFGGREGTASLNANKGPTAWLNGALDDTSDSVNGFCAFHSHEDMGSYQPYTASVDLYHLVNDNPHSHGGLAFNIIDKCTYDFVYFRPHSPTGCYQVGSMRGCHWSSFRLTEACPDGLPPRDKWYRIKVDVTADTVVISKRNFAAAWAQVRSFPTSNVFGNHPVARVGVFVLNGNGDTTYFNRLELQYTPTVGKNEFVLGLSGTAASSALGNAKRVTVDAFRNISSDLSITFSTEPSQSRRLLLV